MSPKKWVLKPENSLVWHREVLGWINKYSGIEEEQKTKEAREAKEAEEAKEAKEKIVVVEDDRQKAL